MLAKGAETLPGKVAHDYKALAVNSYLRLETLRFAKLQKRSKKCIENLRETSRSSRDIGNESPIRNGPRIIEQGISNCKTSPNEKQDV